uniref:Salivary lipocalin n=1 Tax=Triatoma infestans TaxID=30076 RepID=A6YPR9_TRIIF|nr:salivary lipocalin [Triatoma infestans]
MKTILTVILFAFLAFAFADYPTGLTECKHPIAMANFNPKKFLDGKWFVTNAKHGSNSTVCREYKAKSKGNNQELIGDGYYSFSDQTVYFTVRCKRLPKEKKQKQQPLKFTCTQKNPTDKKLKIPFQLEVTVLHTDYADYAIMYRCVKFPPELKSLIEDNTLVLQRKANKPVEKDSCVDKILKKQGLSLESFKSRKGVVCTPPPKKKKV